MSDRYAKIREALEMGPTPGPWTYDRRGDREDMEELPKITTVAYCCDYVIGLPSRYPGGDYRYDPSGSPEADTAFIAACDPDTIRELLAERDALAAENERLRAERVWQPIETAPMDGTKVDLWVVDPLGEGKRIPDCSWGWGQWIGSKGLAAERLGHEATHWIYRPTPPQE